MSMPRLVALVAADYRVHYRARDKTLARHYALFLPRVITNPSLHATILIRLAYASPAWTIAFWRNLLLTKHAIDIGKNVEIGPGLNLPHPWGVTLGFGTQIGADCTIFHGVTVGVRARHQRSIAADGMSEIGGRPISPTIGDDVIIYPGAMIVGPIIVSDGAIVGARSWVDRDVGPGAIVSAGRQ